MTNVEAIQKLADLEYQLGTLLEDLKSLDLDPRKLAIAKTDFEKTFIWTRSVIKKEGSYL